MAELSKTDFDILILDDHPAVREGLRVILSRLEGVVCTVCESVEELTNMLCHHVCHDLYVLDLEFPQSDIFPVLGKINEQYPEARILIYTMHEEPWVLSRIDAYRVHGYVSKSDSMETLCEAVNKLRNGGESFCQTCQNARKQVEESPSNGIPFLTDREKQVMYYLSKGYTTQEIADKLHISYYTAKTHRNHLVKKLHAKNAIDIVMQGKKYL